MIQKTSSQGQDTTPGSDSDQRKHTKPGLVSFDIETGPLPEDKLAALMPEFDESTVKVGNLKDPEKIKAKIEDARSNHKRSFYEKAALSAVTGQVVAIGVYNALVDVFEILGQGDKDEPDVLDLFWGYWEEFNELKFVGLNIFDFDLPFLMRRSWLLDVYIPPSVFDGRYFHRSFVDLRRTWLCGQRPDQIRSSFDELGRAFGTGGKPDDGTTGADFADLWWNDRDKAIAYLKNDLMQPVEWAKRMGVI